MTPPFVRALPFAAVLCQEKSLRPSTLLMLVVRWGWHEAAEPLLMEGRPHLLVELLLEQNQAPSYVAGTRRVLLCVLRVASRLACSSDHTSKRRLRRRVSNSVVELDIDSLKLLTKYAQEACSKPCAMCSAVRRQASEQTSSRRHDAGQIPDP